MAENFGLLTGWFETETYGSKYALADVIFKEKLGTNEAVDSGEFWSSNRLV